MTSRCVFITGAAAGIGRSSALTFARAGYAVGAYDIDVAGLATLAADIESDGGEVITGHLDVTDADEFGARLDEFAEQHGGRLDVLLNNAGILRAGAFEDIPLTAQHKLIDVNIKGVTNGCHRAFRHLRATPDSVVVNMASASAIYGQAELATYSATKFYVRGFTEALDLEWDKHGIRVISVWPLFVETGMTAGIDTGSTESLGIHLGPQQVADEVLGAVEEARGKSIFRQVHHVVGLQAKVMALGARYMPSQITRTVNKWVTHS